MGEGSGWLNLLRANFWFQLRISGLWDQTPSWTLSQHRVGLGFLLSLPPSCTHMHAVSLANKQINRIIKKEKKDTKPTWVKDKFLKATVENFTISGDTWVAQSVSIWLLMSAQVMISGCEFEPCVGLLVQCVVCLRFFLTLCPFSHLYSLSLR